MQREYSSLLLLEKMAIINGGSRGISAGIALELATRGANVGARNLDT
jgi:NAD(P)-dependent dehydrogenase (short-subunit alcohol dehydrogenase family)